jgi:transposase
MPEKRGKFDAEFGEGAVRLVRETGKPVAVIARDLGVNEGTLGNWVVGQGGPGGCGGSVLRRCGGAEAAARGACGAEDGR